MILTVCYATQAVVKDKGMKGTHLTLTSVMLAQCTTS